MKVKNAAIYLALIVTAFFIFEYYILLPAQNAPEETIVHQVRYEPIVIEEIPMRQFIIPANESQSGEKLDLKFLPTFTEDVTEYVFGSIIERQANSYQLHITTFFLCHLFLDESPDLRIHPFTKGIWARALNRFRLLEYSPQGQRTTGSFECRIREAASVPLSLQYTVPGAFVPNNLSPDLNANHLLDVLRCPLRDPRAAYDRYGDTDEHLQVEILKDGACALYVSPPSPHLPFIVLIAFRCAAHSLHGTLAPATHGLLAEQLEPRLPLGRLARIRLARRTAREAARLCPRHTPARQPREHSQLPGVHRAPPAAGCRARVPAAGRRLVLPPDGQLPARAAVVRVRGPRVCRV